MELGSSFLFLQEQIKDIIIIITREIVLFIGTQCSNLHTSVHTPA